MLLGRVLLNILSMCVVILLETQTAVSARTRPSLVQIDIYFRMPQWSVTSVADGLPAVHQAYGLFGNELHGAQWSWLCLHGSLLEARV